MRVFTLLLAFFGLIDALESHAKVSFASLGYQGYMDESLACGNISFEETRDNISAHVSAEYLYSDRYEQRRYVRIREMRLLYEDDLYDFSIGKEIRFLGELEGWNIVDLYNQKNILNDPFDKSAKLGTWGVNAHYYPEDTVYFEVFAKFLEEEQQYPTHDTPYAFFDLDYTQRLSFETSKTLPTLGIILSFMDDTLFEIQSNLGIMHGYDVKRDFIVNSSGSLAQKSYLVDKYFFASAMVLEDTLLKFETAYTDVLSYRPMEDYMQISGGLEYPFYDIFGIDITMFAEYYRYAYLQNGVRNVDISELYDNDLFLAFRIDFADIGSSELKGGVLHDMKTDEEILKIEAKHRITDTFLFEAQLVQTLAKNDSLLRSIGDTTRVGVSLSYTF